MSIEYKVRDEWVQTDSGRVCVAKAVSKKGRILGVVKIEVPLDVGFDLATIYGNQFSEQMIVDAAVDIANRMGEAATHTS